MRFTRLTSPLLIIWKTDLKEDLITWDTILPVWSMSKSLRSFGLIARIRISKTREEMKRKEK